MAGFFPILFFAILYAASGETLASILGGLAYLLGGLIIVIYFIHILVTTDFEDYYSDISSASGSDISSVSSTGYHDYGRYESNKIELSDGTKLEEKYDGLAGRNKIVDEDRVEYEKGGISGDWYKK